MVGAKDDGKQNWSNFQEGDEVQLVFLGQDPAKHEELFKPEKVEEATVVGFFIPHNDGCYVFKTKSGKNLYVEPFPYPYDPEGSWPGDGLWPSEEDWEIPPTLRGVGSYTVAPTTGHAASLFRPTNETYEATPTTTLLPLDQSTPEDFGAILVVPRQPLVDVDFVDRLKQCITRAIADQLPNFEEVRWHEVLLGDELRVRDKEGLGFDARVIFKVEEDFKYELLLVASDGKVRKLSSNGKPRPEQGTFWNLEGLRAAKVAKLGHRDIHNVRFHARGEVGRLPESLGWSETEHNAEVMATVTGKDVWVDVEYSFGVSATDTRTTSYLAFKVLN